MRSANEKSSSDLINIFIVNTSAENPFLGSLHENVLTRIDIDLCMVDLVVNLIALKNIINFATDLEKYFNKGQAQTPSVGSTVNKKVSNLILQICFSSFKVNLDY